MKIGEGAVIRTGLILSRKQAVKEPVYRYKALTLRSVDPLGTVDAGALDVFDSKEVLSGDFLTQEGDIILRLTEPYTAVLIDESLTGIVVSANFLIVRADPQIFDPSYLLWLLNAPKTRHHFYQSGSGNMLSAINAGIVTNYDTDYISVFDQRTLGAFYRSATRESMLHHRLADAKLKYNMITVSDIQKRMKGKNK